MAGSQIRLRVSYLGPFGRDQSCVGILESCLEAPEGLVEDNVDRVIAAIEGTLYQKRPSSSNMHIARLVPLLIPQVTQAVAMSLISPNSLVQM